MFTRRKAAFARSTKPHDQKVPDMPLRAFYDLSYLTKKSVQLRFSITKNHNGTYFERLTMNLTASFLPADWVELIVTKRATFDLFLAACFNFTLALIK